MALLEEYSPMPRMVISGLRRKILGDSLWMSRWEADDGCLLSRVTWPRYPPTWRAWQERPPPPMSRSHWPRCFFRFLTLLYFYILIFSQWSQKFKMIDGNQSELNFFALSFSLLTSDLDYLFIRLSWKIKLLLFSRESRLRPKNTNSPNFSKLYKVQIIPIFPNQFISHLTGCCGEEHGLGVGLRARFSRLGNSSIVGSAWVKEMWNNLHG